jgi:hypothetical protein
MKTIHTLRLTLAVLECMTSGDSVGNLWMFVLNFFFLIHCAGNVHVIKNRKRD